MKLSDRRSLRNKRRPPRRPLRIESLELRQLLAGDISGTIYQDLNADGIRDQGERGLASWTVFLDDNLNGTLDDGETSGLTDADGHYQFRGLDAGNHRVAEVVRSGWTPTNPASGFTDITLADGQDRHVDFLNSGTGGTGAITGNVWRDLNADGVKDSTDTGIFGWQVFIDLNGDNLLDPDEPFEITDGEGNYTFSGLLGGGSGDSISYEVQQVLPLGWEPSPGYDENYTAEVVEGEVFIGPDFANSPVEVSSVSGIVWNDLDGDGVRDTGEPGLSGWQVFADLNTNNALDVGEPVTTSSASGSYQIFGLEPGAVRIAEVQQLDFRPTSPASGFQTVTAPNSGTRSGVNFGNQQRTDAAIGGVIFADRNQNGARDASEEGLPNITVFLDLNDDGFLDEDEPSTVTSQDLFYTPDVDEAGTYLFEKLAGGTYVVRQVLPDVLSATPTSERVKSVSLGPTDARRDIDSADRYRASEIHGVKFEDINGNGAHDSGEPGLNGVTIFLDLNRDNIFDADVEPWTTTAADGSYEFLGLASGAYVVREVVPLGFVQTFPATLGGILWPEGSSNPVVGNVSPSLIQASLAQGETLTQSVSLTLPTTGALTDMVDVFLLFDDTGSFRFNSPIVRAAFPNIISELQTRLPGIDLGFGVGRLEEYGGFAAEYTTGRPFVLNQPVISSSATGYTDAEVLASIQAALDREAPGYGGDRPETVIEALYQMVTGAGFDGNDNGSLLDSGAAGLASTQVTPGNSGDVPAFASFVPDIGNNVLAPSGTIGGAGFRSGALPIIITATDTGFAYQPKGESSITGIDGLTLPTSSITHNGRGTTPFNNGAGIQETVTGLNALGALVIGLGTTDAASSDPRIGLESLASLTGAINRTTNTIANGTADDIAPGDPFYFKIGSGGDPLVFNISDGIVAAIEGAVTAVNVNVTLRASDPRVHIAFTPDVLTGLGAGDTATFDVTFTGDGRPHRFDLQFVREGTDVVLGSIPVVLGTPIVGDGYEFEECDDGIISFESNFGNQRVADFILSSRSLTVAEGGSQDFSVQLAAPPVAPITVAVSRTSGDSDITVAEDALLFTTDNWDIPQAVTVVAAEDGDTIDGSATITVSALGLTSVDVLASEVDNDTQGLLVTPTSLGVNEGSSASFSVALAAQPAEPVTVDLSISGDSDLTLGTATLTFDSSNWNTPRSVVVNAAEDADTANGSATITATSAGLTSVDVLASEVDNDTQGLLVTPTSLGVNEGSSASFSVALAAQPAEPVTVDLSISGDSDLTLGTATLTFDSSNWNTPRSVVVNAAEDADATNGSATITATSAGLTSVDVLASEVDNDSSSGESHFLVVDQSRRQTYQYDVSGTPLGTSRLDPEEEKPRGIASNSDASRSWIVDQKGEVFIYDADGGLLGSWSLEGVDKPEGIAVFGNDLWIVDRGEDRVSYFEDGALRFSGASESTSDFSLARGNRNPYGLTTDGSHLWVVNNTSASDSVFRYSLDGILEGSWQIDPRNANPSGISLDPVNMDDIWIVDRNSDSLFLYQAGAGQTSGSLLASNELRLQPQNRNPQGLAMQPATGSLLPTLSAGVPNWHNIANPLDTDDDGVIAPLDVLLILNSDHDEEDMPASILMLDVDGNDWITAVDALLVINYQNQIDRDDLAAKDSAFESLLEEDLPLLSDMISKSVFR